MTIEELLEILDGLPHKFEVTIYIEKSTSYLPKRK